MAPVLAVGVAGVVPLESMVQRTSSWMAPDCAVNARQQKTAASPLVDHPKLLRGRLMPIGWRLASPRSSGLHFPPKAPIWWPAT